MIKNTVIITAENKENTISNTIQSCLKQSNQNIEIIVAYSNLKNENKVKKKNKSKNIIFLKIKKKLINKVQDQLFKVKQSLKISKGRNIFLLDGDDIFDKSKVSFVSKVIGYKKIMVLDNYFIIENNNKFKNRPINYKENYFYKRLINDWPKNVCTSSISIERGLLLKFFKDTDISKYKYLAIDILLTIYCDNKKKLLRINKFLTSKIELHGSVDKKYIGYTNKLYWQRRLEQHRYNFFIKKKKFYNLDFFVTYLLSFLFKN